MYIDWVGIIVDIVSLFVAILTFIITSRGDRKATEEQTKRESVRATLTDFAELRRSHQDFPNKMNNMDLSETDKDEAIKSYLADLERFAVGCSKKAYDINVVNDMSGGMLIAQYRKYFKSYIEKRRRLLIPESLIPVNRLYDAVVTMIKNLCEIRKEQFDDVAPFPEDQRVLERFLDLPIDSSESVFSIFRSLPGAIEEHGQGKEGYLYVPGSRTDRCVLVAHADTYFDKEYKEVSYSNSVVYEDGIYKGTSTEASIGADDRSGCAILWLLRNSGHSLLILDGEEHGQIGAKYLKESNPVLFDEINSHSFILQFDRQGSNDYRYYDIPVSHDFITYIEKETGYLLAEGKGRTDIIVLCRDICGVNLSIGYYDEHKPSEKLVVSEWLNTLEIARGMLEKKLKRYVIEQ